jgi:hypothetical protein
VRLAADDGADLGKLLDRGQPVEPRHQRIVQVRRDRERRQRARKLVVIASIGYFGPGSSEALAAHERADQLSQELGDRKGRFRARFHAKGVRERAAVPFGDLVGDYICKVADRIGARRRSFSPRCPRMPLACRI